MVNFGAILGPMRYAAWVASLPLWPDDPSLLPPPRSFVMTALPIRRMVVD